MFVDQVKVTLRAGKGGDGCLSFRRERGVPRGGPDGGRGGNGGSIYLISSKSINSLAYFRFHPINKAKKGAHGEGSNRQGKKGIDLELRVPVGTIVRDVDGDQVLFDFVSAEQRYLAAEGGKGGRGNASFATSTQRAPRFREEGKPGDGKELILELKLIADVGLVGFPNVGKSTLISRISAAKPVIADYPFTTLVPNLGVVDVDEYRSFVIADIPGLIEGAHLGHGLGTKFLRHVERTKILVHIVDVSPYTERDPIQDYRTVMKELEAFDPKLAERRQILVANKIDLLDRSRERLEKVEAFAVEEKCPFYAISALKKQGLRQVVAAMKSMLEELEESEKDTNGV
jgi:GTP-binding protein